MKVYSSKYIVQSALPTSLDFIQHGDLHWNDFKRATLRMSSHSALWTSPPPRPCPSPDCTSPPPLGPPERVDSVEEPVELPKLPTNELLTVLPRLPTRILNLLFYEFFVVYA